MPEFTLLEFRRVSWTVGELFLWLILCPDHTIEKGYLLGQLISLIISYIVTVENTEEIMKKIIAIHHLNTKGY